MPHDPVKLLLVDDVDKNLLALEALLQDEGLELFTAQSGAEALELLLVHEFALALLDVQMPGMDGFELAELMRGTERTRRIPIIFITAVATDERRRFRGYEAGAVDYLLKPFDPQSLKSKVAVFVELDRQRRDLARQRDELSASAERLSEALGRIQAHGDNSPLAVVEFDHAFRIMNWSKGAERVFGWSAAEMMGKRIGDIRWLHEADQADFMSLASQMLSGMRPRAMHVARTCRKDGAVIECEWYHSALLDAAGKPISINSQVLDVTERRRAEETQQLLIGELNHRVKNTLATVQAIATQTLRHSANPADFAANFAGRIQSLARAHSLLSDATWKGASLTSLVEDQLRVGTIDEKRLNVSGPDVFLSPQLALYLALILHELITNANKYGALSAAYGRVDLSWTVADERLHLKWAESGASGVKAPAKRGFGTTLIEQSAKAEGGDARASYRADGVTWDVTLSIPQIAAPSVPERTAAGAAAADRHLRQPTSGDASRPALAGKRFLVIEDEPVVALEIRNILEDAGAEIVGLARTAEQAWHIMESASFDAALLDGNLHGHAVDDIAAALTRRNVPFAFVSGYGRESLPRAFAQAAVVSKPFIPGELLDVARQLAPARAEVLRFKQ